MEIFNSIMKAIKDLLIWVLDFLPSSPFQALDNSPVAQYLPYINWFMPLPFMLSTMELWLTAVAAYYIYSAILRWVKAVS